MRRPQIASNLPFGIAPGERFAGKYVVERTIGSGGMGVVVSAWHERLGQRVAIKLLEFSGPEPVKAIDRFLREARAAAALSSEHIVRIMDVDVDEAGHHFIVMEYLEGQDLRSLISNGEPLPIETSVGYVLQACEAIANAHAFGIIHHDLKPENMFLTLRPDGSPLVKVLDFGVSRILGHDFMSEGAVVSSVNVILGTSFYMSPEQVRFPAEVDPRSDIWALGVILYELLTGQRPFSGRSSADVMAAVLMGVVPPPHLLRPEIPRDLSEVVTTCLRKLPTDRFPNVGVLAERLLPWVPPWAEEAAVRASRISEMRPVVPDRVDRQTVLPVTIEAELPGGAGAGEGGRARSTSRSSVLACLALSVTVALAWLRWRSPGAGADAVEVQVVEATAPSTNDAPPTQIPEPRRVSPSPPSGRSTQGAPGIFAQAAANPHALVLAGKPIRRPMLRRSGDPIAGGRPSGRASDPLKGRR